MSINTPRNSSVGEHYPFFCGKLRLGDGKVLNCCSHNLWDFFPCQPWEVPGSSLQVIFTPSLSHPGFWMPHPGASHSILQHPTEHHQHRGCAAPPGMSRAQEQGLETHWDSGHCWCHPAVASRSPRRGGTAGAICISGVCRRCHQADILASCVSQRIHFRGVSLPPSQSGWLDLD